MDILEKFPKVKVVLDAVVSTTVYQKGWYMAEEPSPEMTLVALVNRVHDPVN